MPATKATPNVLGQRLKTFRQRIRDADLDAALLVNPIDIRYLTGFVGDDSWAVVPARSNVVTIFSDFRFEEQVQREAPHCNLVLRDQSLPQALAKWLGKRSVDSLGLQSAQVTLGLRDRLVQELDAKKLVSFDDGLLKQRSVKSPDEVRLIGKALKIQQAAYRETLEFLRPGMTEYEVCAFLEYRMRALGADGVSFPSIVAAEPNGSLPHAIPGRRKIKPGGTVLFDWGAKYQGYCSDLTRVIAVGRMKPKLREVYQVVLDAQLAAIDAIRPGVELKQVDAVARGVIEEAGYGDRFGHGLGHGIGLEIHEGPRLAKSAEGELETGQVVTVEPGIYLPGVGGVRIEDDVLVTARGHRVLSDLPKSLESAII